MRAAAAVLMPLTSFAAVRRSKTGQQRRTITRIQMTARVQQMGIPGHGCHDSRRESRLWVGGATFALL